MEDELTGPLSLYIVIPLYINCYTTDQYCPIITHCEYFA